MRCVAGILLMMTDAASAQSACRSMYRLGESVPAACRDRLATGLPAYQRWGEGLGAAMPAPASSGMTAARLEPNYRGGHGPIYGFGR
jgi:hypothetical protein